MAINVISADMHLRSSASMNLFSTGPFSITCWINANWNTSSTLSLIGIYGPATDTPLAQPVTAVQLGSRTGNGELSAWTWGGRQLAQTSNGVMTSLSNKWIAIAYTFDGTTHRLYAQGVLVAADVAIPTAGFLNQVYINGYPTATTSETGTFQIDKYVLFRRTLTPDEIQTIFVSGGGRHGINNGVVCQYEFDELAQGGNVTSIVDLSGNGNTLTPVGSASPMTYNYVNTYADSNIRPVQ